MECTTCKDDDEVKCPVCQGKGLQWLDGTPSDCPACDGLGYLACPVCIGKEEAIEVQLSAE